MSDLYGNLRISSDATEDEIKAAKKARSKETHPDRGGDPEEFDRVTKAALVLLDPEKRQRYDATGETEDPGMSEDQTLQGALGLARQAIEGFLEHGDPERQDIIAKAIQGLEVSGKERQTYLGQLERKLKKQERLIKRLKYRGKKADLIGNMMREKAEAIRSEIRQCNDAIKAHDIAIEILGDYDWEHEPVETAYFHSGGPVSGTFLNPGKI